MPLHVVERDYVQCLYLREIFELAESLVFKGGTALRHVHGLDRYSEDLDFNHPEDRETIISLTKKAAKRLERYGIRAGNRDLRWSTTGLGFSLSFQGPLYRGASPSKGKIRVDISTREEDAPSENALVRTDYADVKGFWVRVLTQEELAAEKFRALVIRGKPRDLFDLWYLYRHGMTPDKKTVEKKLALYSMDLAKMNTEEILEKATAQWEQDISILLRQKPPLDVVMEDIKGLFNEILDEG
ncbi:MAG: nucleotidyl transferase AbiEii/AbiGii toxin family protein [Thermoplasmata archaeon]|nr:nucleotidyl transferase AbiEii/AbiGii toxin family protein [Thermoplasmata archaeon]